MNVTLSEAAPHAGDAGVDDAWGWTERRGGRRRGVGGGVGADGRRRRWRGRLRRRRWVGRGVGGGARGVAVGVSGAARVALGDGDGERAARRRPACRWRRRSRSAEASARPRARSRPGRNGVAVADSTASSGPRGSDRAANAISSTASKCPERGEPPRTAGAAPSRLRAPPARPGASRSGRPAGSFRASAAPSRRRTASGRSALARPGRRSGRRSRPGRLPRSPPYRPSPGPRPRPSGGQGAPDDRHPHRSSTIRGSRRRPAASRGMNRAAIATNATRTNARTMSSSGMTPRGDRAVRDARPVTEI